MIMCPKDLRRHRGLCIYSEVSVKEKSSVKALKRLIDVELGIIQVINKD